jgi:hypothetical protein
LYYDARTMSESMESTPINLPEDNFSELLDSIAPPPVKARTVRQGLPTEYRMRHDAHYVEELVTRPHSAATDGAIPPPVTPPTSAALRDMCEEFEGLASCFNLIEQGARPLRERLGLALARIGIQRSVRYAQSLRILLKDPQLHHRELRLDELLRDAFADLKEELRLTESTLMLDIPASPLLLRGDLALLRTALHVCAGAAISLIEASGRPGDLYVSAFASGEILHCEVRQDAFALEPWQLLKLFDLESPERTRRVTAVAMHAARRVAQLHGGQFEARRTSEGGCGFVFSLPKAASVGSPN